MNVIYQAMGRIALESQLRAIQIDALKAQTENLKTLLSQKVAEAEAHQGAVNVTVPDAALAGPPDPDAGP